MKKSTIENGSHSGTKLFTSLLFAAIFLMMFSSFQSYAQTYTYVGSFYVANGPNFYSPTPPTYTGQEAAALIYGGSPSDYAISVNSNTTDASTITHTAYLDGYGDETHLTSPAAENYKENTDYNYPAFSAYVRDHNSANNGPINYVWRVTTCTAPTINCPSNITQGNDAGQCLATVNYAATVTGTSPTVTYSPASGSTFAVGTVTTVTVTATNDCGTATCSFTVTVNDNEPPVISCNNSNITQNNDNGNCSAVVNYTSPTATDNCGGTPTNIIVNGSFETGDYTGWTINSNNPYSAVMGIGTNGQTLNYNQSIYNYANNSNSSVTYPQGLPVTFNTTNGNYMSVFFQNGGDLTQLYQDVTLGNGNSQLCFDMEYINYYNSFNTNQNMAVQILNPNTNAILQTLFITNPGDPQSTPMTHYCFDLSAYAGQQIRVEMDNATINDNPLDVFLDNVTLFSYNTSITQTTGHASGFAFPVGATTNTFLATDQSGNTSSCSFTVTVTDNQPPVIGTCPSNITQCGNHVATFATPSATDNCSATVVCSPASGSTFATGTTTVICTATDPSGNTSTCSFTVTVYDNPTPSISVTETSGNTSNDGILCNGSSATLTVSGGTTYLWNTTATTTSIAVTPTSLTTYIVTATSNGCTATASQAITVNSNPSASSTAGTIACNGGTTTINVTATGGTPSYIGTGSNTVSVGNYTYTVTDANGCMSTTSQSVSQPAAAVTFTTVKTNVSGCGSALGSIAVTASGGTGTKLYSKNNGSAYQGASLFSNLSAASYTVKVKDANNCLSTASILAIGTNLGVTFTTTIIAPSPCLTGTNGKITVLASGGSGYFNYSKDTGITYQSSNLFNSVRHTTYKIRVKDILGCYSDITAVTPGSCREAELVSSNPDDAGYFNIYPNPASNQATIVFSSDKEEGYGIRLIDVTGRVVLQYALTTVIGENQYQMNLSEMAKGIYMVLLQNSIGTLQKKIVVQ